MQLPSHIKEILNTIKEQGQEAFLVGGCVRDILMGMKPVDYDVTSSAAKAEIMSLFPKTVPVGKKFGTVAVVTNHGIVEVSTYKGQEDHLSSGPQGLEKDLLLRDFTINAMAMDEEGLVFDPYGGRQDLKNKLIRAPEDEARERFAEDPLRMMRAVRFYSTLEFSLHSSVYEAIKKNAALLPGVAIERVQNELNRILTSNRPARGLRLLNETGLLGQFLPEVAAMVNFDQRNFRHDKDLFEHTMAVLEAVPPGIKVRLGALLHDIGKTVTFTVDDDGVGHFYGHHVEGAGIASRILKRLRYDNQTVEDVSSLVLYHMSRFAGLRDTGLKKLILEVGEHNLEDLFDLQKADTLGSAPPFEFANLEIMQAGINKILREKLPLSLNDLLVNGNDLIDRGFQPGPFLGEVLNNLLETVLEDPDKNQRELLLEMAEKYLKTSLSEKNAGHETSGWN
ncbi:MAG: HD domain-containing protein [Syntrophomonas sp.]